ncbi:hypothetical protein BD324DRAFT_484357 [Kockovaella imperatae]|uniref:Uncharacterized protein n=1 Tax=Kockovaella imperatae TaxID=4999 RepID=A0A1Y1UE03_9TREE|nr:hypothetical protein BD324DRAFT_484357 [Kockovaella imperatae]ORX36268.1 hypothetical protein BD324DRAFT_484357 [Kockovaella imperatae]
MSHDDRGRGLRGWSPKREEEKPVELLPSPPPPLLRMDEDLTADADPSAGKLTIRGAAAAPRKTLLERLAAAKAEAAEKVNDPLIPPPLPHSISDPVTSAAVPNITGVRAAVQARLRLKLKLASEKKAFVFNQNESRAQALRAMILEAKARREATETDNVLRHMDRLDRAREIRRRLMVEKMMAAETEAERKARELKERLMGEKKARMLREKLKQRKKSQGEALPIVAVL